jgi:hypothetical protein
MPTMQEDVHARVIHRQHVQIGRCSQAPQRSWRNIIQLRGGVSAYSTQTQVVYDVGAVVLRVGRPPGATTR